MRIVDVRCALVGSYPLVRVVTDAGIDGFGPMESFKSDIVVLVPSFRDKILGCDPTLVESTMRRIRRLGGFKPWGAVVSAIEIALWDIAGRAVGLPVHKMLGGKVRDRVRVYNGGVRSQLAGHQPEDYARAMEQMVAAAEGFTIIKEGVGYHGFMAPNVDGFAYGDMLDGPRHPNRAPVTARGINHIVECVSAMKDVLGDRVGLALDIGPGWLTADAIRVARALEPYDVLWAEDLITGDYVPWLHVEQYREVTRATTTPTHTGEQIYTRHNFKDLLSKQAVRVIGPDPCDVGGLAELKWVAELADTYGVAIAPHGVLDGLVGLAALVQVSATLPENFIAFEYPVADEPWWYDAVHGLPAPIVQDGHVVVGDAPGLGIEIDRDLASQHLRPRFSGFFD